MDNTPVSPFTFVTQNYVRPHIDEWIPNMEDIIVNPNFKDGVIMPISMALGVEGQYPLLDYFMLAPKRAYNNYKAGKNDGKAQSTQFKPHMAHYLNYFMKFYDYDGELLSLYSKTKYLIDFEELYDEEAFLSDVKRYFLSDTIIYKLFLLNEDNYTIDISFKGKLGPSQQYTNKHGKLLMAMSFLMNILIPVTTHFIAIKQYTDVNEFILTVFDLIFDKFETDVSDVNIFNKLYETSDKNLNNNSKDHEELWKKQAIRGKSLTTQVSDTTIQLLLTVMPKYEYKQNMVTYNSVCIRETTKYQITDLSYEYKFVPLSSSKRDMDNNSEYDRFESYLIKQEESLYIQNVVNCEQAMERIETLFGPFDPDEVKFYMENIYILDGIQKELLFNLFYKYFGDPVSIKSINHEQYVKLLLSAKKILMSNNLIVLPYILSGKPQRIVTRKNLNKKDNDKVTSTETFASIVAMYNNPKLEKYILSIIATIISSEIEYLDYHDKDLNGTLINIIPEFLREEILIYISLIQG